MWILGIVIVIASIVTQMMYVPATASTWCFFASIASILIYFIVRIYKK
jgi:hypothetical protein